MGEWGESRDWSGMPSDALISIFEKLDAVDLLTGAGLVCRSWRRLANDDCTLWRRVEMAYHGDILETEEAEAMARAAVDRAAGTLEAFGADTFVTDGLLHYISNRAFSLKSLQLSVCDKVSNEGFAEAIKKFPQLEELDISFCFLSGNVCESVGKACPQLKCFRLNERWTMDNMDDDTEALGIASHMPELQELQLIGNSLTNIGLLAILDHCPHLKSLDVRQCFNLQMDDSMKHKCARIGNIRLPHDLISDFKYRAYTTGSGDQPDSDLEVDIYNDVSDMVLDGGGDDEALEDMDELLDVVTDSGGAGDDAFNEVDDLDDAGSESAYDDMFDV